MKGRQKRHAFFDFLPINVWNCNNLWDRQPVTVSCGLRIRVALSLCGMRVQGLVTLCGLGLFNEVVICLHRGSPLNPKFTVSSGSIYKLLSAPNKNGLTPPTLENGISDVMMYFSGVRCSFSSVMLPPLGLYMFDPLLTLKPMLVALLRWGPNANCILVGSWRGRPRRPKEAAFCRTRVCFCSHFLKGAEDFPAAALQFAPGPSEKQHQQRGDWKHDPLRRVFEMLTKENKPANGFVFIYFLCRLWSQSSRCMSAAGNSRKQPNCECKDTKKKKKDFTDFPTFLCLKSSQKFVSFHSNDATAAPHAKSTASSVL